MKNYPKPFLLAAILFAAASHFVYAQAGQERLPQQANEIAASALPLRRVSLLSSGVGYFEHTGRISTSAASVITLPFTLNAVNDALKSLIINDPLSDNPSVQYASSNTLYQTLRSLSVDLSVNQNLANILNSLRGEEIEISAPGMGTAPIKGRIIGVENRSQRITPYDRGTAYSEETWLTLFTSMDNRGSGIRSIALNDIASFSFTNNTINADLDRALELLTQSRNLETRNLRVNLNGIGSRDVAISYVIPTPVWKVSYRLDLSAESGGAASASTAPASAVPALLQGWAIIDNDSDTDWNNVELTLVTGRPVSFIQNLYAPYHTSRPELPLSIEGIAEARSYGSGTGWTTMDFAEDTMVMNESAPMASMRYAPQMEAERGRALGGTVQTAQGSMAGDQFEFTFRNPVSLQRRQSAMFPLVENTISAEKTLVFSGARAQVGRTINPAISVELTNTSGMRLPAGPITVYDSGSYAGDALIEFFPENEKRLISYAEDLTVSGSVSATSSRTVSAVNVTGGVMTITRRQDYERTYSVRNAAGTEKRLIIEHTITQGTSLEEPRSYSERTPDLYRFSLTLPANREIQFNVREALPVSERITLAQLRPETFLSYTTNQEIPANIRASLLRAVELKRIADEAVIRQQEAENQRTRLFAEQDRIRRNLEAAGNQSPQGQEYLNRLTSLDREIDETNAAITGAIRNADAAKKEYDDYLANLYF